MYIDSFLLVTILFLTILNSLLPYITTKYFKPFIMRCFDGGMGVKRQELSEQKQLLKSDQSNLNMVNDFAKYSKLQRKINAIDEQLSEMRSSQGGKNMVLTMVMPHILKLFTSVIFLAIIILYRHSPVIILSNQLDLTPLSKIISYPNQELNAISVHFWIMCCSAAVKLVQIKV